jgi:soluble lytic murein transglycosylase
MKFLRKKRVFALLLIGFILFLFMNSSFIGKKIYPIYYQKEIKTSAEKHNIDPFLIAALIRVETNYKYQLESSKGAMGLMQIMPDTANWIADAAKVQAFKPADLLKPEVNIFLGAWYMNWLTKLYNGNVVYAIAAYNAGQGNVNQWKNNGIWDGKETNLDHIPFGETRHYVQRVLYYYHKYQYLYSKDWQAAQG